MEPIRPGKEVTRGVWERIKGAFKKGAGAAVGNDRLRATGELHEMQADAHIEAAERKMRADELREEAAKQFVEREQKVAEAREDVAVETAAKATAIEQRKRQTKTTIDKRGQERVRASRARADVEKKAATRKEQDAKRKREQARNRSGARRVAAKDAREAAKALDEVQQDIEGGG